MTTLTYAGATVETDAEGFLQDPQQWTEEMAPELARREGIEPLTDAHWAVIRFMRSEYAAKGTGPTVRILGKSKPTKEMPLSVRRLPATAHLAFSGPAWNSSLRFVGQFWITVIVNVTDLMSSTLPARSRERYWIV